VGCVGKGVDIIMKGWYKLIKWAKVGRDVKHGVCAAAQFATRAAGSVGYPEKGGRKACSDEQGTARVSAG